MNIPGGHKNKRTLDYIIYNKRNLNDIISCPICLEKYKHPRNLKCGHSFCTTCLHTINFNNEITCPLCREITSFDENNLLINLPINTTLVSIIDETDNKIDNKLDNKHLQVKRSKSVDSFIKYSRYNKNIKKRQIYNNRIDNEHNDDYIVECQRECCSFQ
tara:strand:- start:133 stop:612 length:480 start_codon:yes stop_codon:yes gene_type:complete